MSFCGLMYYTMRCLLNKRVTRVKKNKTKQNHRRIRFKCKTADVARTIVAVEEEKKNYVKKKLNQYLLIDKK